MDRHNPTGSYGAASTASADAPAPAPTDFPVAGGALGRLIRAHDWSATSLGPIAKWPQSLRTAVDIVVRSPAAMVLMWGPDHVMIYNDGYIPIAGDKHPRALGGTVERTWPEIWDWNRVILAAGLAGEARAYRSQPLRLSRGGVAEDVWFDLYYTPVSDENGVVRGVLCTAPVMTERVLAEQALREREAEIARVQEIGGVGGVEVDLRDGFRNRRSPEYLKIHGLPPDAVRETHEDWVKRVHPEDRERTVRNFINAVKTNTRDYTAEYRIIRPSDGEMRWIAVKAEIERDAAGHPLRLVGAHIDITERKLADMALRESEERFRLIANSAPVPMWVSRLDGKRAFANQAYLDFLGLPYDDAVVFDWRKALHPDDRDRILREQVAGESSLKPFVLEARYRRADGEWRWLRSESQPRWGADGTHIGFIGVAHDVTAAKQAEIDLRRLNETLEAQVTERTRERDRIWAVSQDLLLVSDENGVWLSANPAWTAVLGWSNAELIGRTSEWLEHPEDRARTRAEIAHLAAGGNTLRFENRFRHKDGSHRWLSWTATPADGLIYAVARDITAEKEAAETLRRTEDALRQAQKMEAVGQLTGGIAHDFNNLLTGIIGALDLLRRRIASGRIEDIDRFIDAATTSANRAAGLTHRLLAFSRRQSLDHQPIDLNRMIASMSDLLRRTLGEQIQLAVELRDGLWTAEADPNQLESAILNLAINARDAMPTGGRLVIQSNNTRLEANDSQLEGHIPGDYVVMCVGDTGTGMTETVKARAFEPFFTTKPIGQGTGLGLSMVYGFAMQTGGHVKIESDVGQGTTVKIYLPRYRGGIADGSTESAETAVNRAEAGETVMVVEDDASVRLLVTEVLADLGYRTIEAVDGKSALPILQSPQRIDLLVSDVGLPGMNGRELADIARESRPGLRVLFISGYAENAAIRGEFLAPGMHLLGKPFALDVLAAKIREMLAR